jgi:hypothetical protein
MSAAFFAIFVMLISQNILADQVTDYQKQISRLKPNERLKQLEKDLSPSDLIALDKVDDWQRGNQFKKCLQDEVQYLGIERGLMKHLSKSLKSKNSIGFEKLFANSVDASLPKISSFSKIHTVEGIDVFAFRQKNNTTSSLSNSFVGSYDLIEDIELNGLEYLVPEQSRSKRDLNYNEVFLKVRYDLRGFNKDGFRQNDRGLFTVQIIRGKNDWKIKKISFIDGERVVARRDPSFEDQTVSSGLNSVAINERSEAIRRGGYAISLQDLNKDGILDIFTGSAKTSQVLIGQAGGGWIVDENHPLSKFSAVKTAVFADFDNDGYKEAIMTLFEYDRDDSDLVYMDNSSGNFVQVKSFLKGKLDYNLPMPASVADFDQDGYLDLYVGFPGQRDFTVLSDDEDGFKYPQGMFYNIASNGKEKKFVDVTKSVWGKKGLSKYNRVFPHSSIATDYDFDGDVDLLVVDDRSNLSPFYDNIGGKKFETINDSIKVNNKGYGMGVAIGDLNNNGINDIAITNVNFHARKRFHDSCQHNWYFDNLEDPGVRLFQGERRANDDKPIFKNITEISGVDFIGEGAAGIEFIDYNNDGLLDIYIANGLWSGSHRDKEHDLSSLFVRAVAANKTYNDVLSPYRTYRQRDWSFVSILREGEFVHTPSMAGYQRNRLFLNMGNMKFIEVGYLEGVDSIADGYVIATGDVDADGKMDLVLRNGDPGTMAYKFPTIQYFKNNYKAAERNFLTFSIEGVQSNRDGIGSTLRVTTGDGVTRTRHLSSNNGAAQSQTLLHVGLGSHKTAESVSLTWATGKEQKLGALKAGHYFVKEGEKPVLISPDQALKVSAKE